MITFNKNEANYISELVDEIPKRNIPNIEYELEVRIRTINMSTGKSHSGVTSKKFNELLSNKNLFEFDSRIVEKTLIMKESETSNDRLICYPQIKDEKGKTKKVYMAKTVLRNRIIDRLGIKISLSKERILPKPEGKKYHFVRYRIRTSILSYNQIWRFDFTHIFEGYLEDEGISQWYNKVKKSNIPNKYEVELEYIGDIIEPEHIVNSLDSLLEKMGFAKRVEEVEDTCYKHDIYDGIKNVMKNEKFKMHYKQDSINFHNIIENVKTLQRYNLDYIRRNSYQITEKVDGERYLLYIHTEGPNTLNVKLLDSRDNCHVLLNHKTDVQELIDITPILIDGELFDTFENKKISLEDIVNNIKKMIKSEKETWEMKGKKKKIKTFYGFDIVIYKGNDLTKIPFSKRFSYLQKTSKFLETIFDNQDLNYQIKKYLDFNRENVKEIITKKNNYSGDGIIFVPVDQTYYNNNTYKWKPTELNSIDFLSRIVNDDTRNKIITLHLYVGVNKKTFERMRLKHNKEYKRMFGPKYDKSNFFPIEFQPKDFPCIYVNKLKYRSKKNGVYVLKIGNVEITDDCVLEAIYNFPKKNNILSDSKESYEPAEAVEEFNRWVVLRLREDKTEKYKQGYLFGNSWWTAINNWKTIKNPITINDLTPEKYYIKKYGKTQQKSKIDGMKKFHNYIKFGLYLKYTKNIEFLLELGGGRANDLFKWGKANIKHVVIIDADKDALEQAVKRRKQYKYTRPKLTLIQGNLQTTRISKLLLKPFFNTKLKSLFNVIACQFAFHYFIKDITVLKNIIHEIYNLLDVDGYFILTDHDGQKIFDLFKNNNIGYNESLYITSKGISTSFNNTSQQETSQDNQRLSQKVKETSNSSDLLFKMTRQYKGKKLQKAGQKISVYVDSIGIEHQEYLVNYDEIIKLMTEKNKFMVVEDNTFAYKYDKFVERRKIELSKGEKIFSFTNRYVVFKKNFIKDTKVKKSRKKFI